MTQPPCCCHCRRCDQFARLQCREEKRKDPSRRARVLQLTVDGLTVIGKLLVLVLADLDTSTIPWPWS